MLLLQLSLLPEGETRIRSYGQTVEGLNINAPLGLLYLAAMLKKHGYHAEVSDQRIEQFDASSITNHIQSLGYRSVGFYCCDYDLLRDKIIYYIQAIKRRCRIPIIVGGPPFDHERLLAHGADAVCVGEGETTILSWMEYVEGSRSIQSVPGIRYTHADGTSVATTPSGLIQDLDSLPFPYRRYPDRYRILGNPYCRRPVLEVTASRGCPFHCAFCATPEFWQRRVRLRSPENVIEELTQLKGRHGARYFHFRDDIFGTNLSWIDRFAELYMRENLSTHWSCYLHPLSFGQHQERYFELLSRIGCDMVCIGLQTVVPSILTSIDRRPEEAQAFARQIRVARKHNMLTFASVIFGLPGEQRHTIRATTDYLKKNRPDILVILPLQKLRGSAIAQRYPSGPVCELTDQEINTAIAKATRSFYLSIIPMAIFCYRILKNNPRWFLEVLPFLLTGLKFFQILPRRANW